MFTSIKAHHFGITKNVSLWYSEVITTPLTFGLFKPVILLPVALVNQLSLEETETLIIHELTHIKNNDYVFNWMLIICETIYFFNPFIRLLAKEVKLEREKDCDTQVLHFKYPPITYAETLLKTAQFKKSQVPFILAAVLKNSQLLTRIKYFTTEKNLAFHRKNYTRFAFVPIMIMLLFNIYLLNTVRINKTDIGPAATALKNKLKTITFPRNQESFPVLAGSSTVATSLENPVTVSTVAPVSAAKPVRIEDEHILAEPVEYAMPVAMTEMDDTKEVTVNEENSATGETVTKVYEMKFADGEWTAKMKWMLIESKLADSLKILADSLSVQHYRLSLLQQQ
jgi:BlaR1 peptidase M56